MPTTESTEQSTRTRSHESAHVGVEEILDAANRGTIRRLAQILVEEIGVDQARVIATRFKCETCGTRTVWVLLEMLSEELERIAPGGGSAGALT